MFGNIVGIIFSSSLIFLCIYYVKVFSSKFIETIRIQRSSAEILYIFNMLKEDIMKAKVIDIIEQGSILELQGFLMSLSDDENADGWGIILDCYQDIGKAIVYNLNPQKNILIWDNVSGEIENLFVLSKRKLAGKIYEVLLQRCDETIVGKIAFSDLFKVRWYSEGKRIYREVSRYGASYRAKFFVGEGKIQILNSRVYIKTPDEKTQISFSVY